MDVVTIGRGVAYEALDKAERACAIGEEVDLA
jgi:hypothetical protein